jgi:hypothetical protein
VKGRVRESLRKGERESESLKEGFAFSVLGRKLGGEKSRSVWEWITPSYCFNFS